MIKLLCASIVWGSIMAATAQPQLTTNSPVEWLKIVPTHGLRSTNPHIHNQDRLTKILPYAVDVTNQGTQAVELLAIVFNVKYSGKPDTIRKEFIFNSFNTSSDPVVAPGVTRLFTPFRTYNALAAGAQNAYLIAKDGKPMSENIDKYRFVESIQVNVDLVVLADGSYLGPDTTHTIKTYSDRARAFQDMKSELTTRAARREDVRTWLQSIASQNIVHLIRDQSNTAYQDAQTEYARIFLRHLDKVGVEGVVQSISKTSRFQSKLLNLHKGDQ